ncbi:hypothetical protein G4177_06820 [Corallococcus sp. ZKHCc1 1396]|uniref:Uncharacterized protein n=1 Tax=Corallococcus soli TaxID=2710757 RepID=A0ABR9PJ10_9BACT|nr:hypothetical protein [Corallococcus soli]MBE4747891.1 hypothetical protein [Corallococcus soli]
MLPGTSKAWPSRPMRCSLSQAKKSGMRASVPVLQFELLAFHAVAMMGCVAVR